ncbi:unnamed protein product, partial [Brenthis ino]
MKVNAEDVANATEEIVSSTTENVTEKLNEENNKCNCRCGERNEATRIVGGVETAVNEFPWVARLNYFNKFYCAGMLINDRYVLTAAHCVKGLMWFMMKVTLGDHNRCNKTQRPEVRYVVDLVAHNFTYLTFRDDIAVLKLNDRVNISNTIKPVCLPHDDAHLYTGVKAIAVGWGSVGEQMSHSCNLLDVELPVLSNEVCRNTKYDSSMITDGMLCAGYPEQGKKDTCQGDSGGPLTAERSDKRYEVLGCGMLQNDVPDMPWLATINTGKTIIRGTLISDRHVITAASPLLRKSPIDVIVNLGAFELCKGENALNISVEAISIHPGYYSTGKFNDLALLKLSNNVMFNKLVSPICMPVYDNVGADQIAWTSTWMRNKTEYCLSQITTVPIIPSRSCARNSVYPPEIIISDKGCLGPARSKSIVCEVKELALLYHLQVTLYPKEDIGSPVMTRWSAGSPFRLIGVVTFASCKDEVSPLFTKIVDNLMWIQENIRNDCQCF